MTNQIQPNQLIGQVTNTMLTLLLARFIFNDVPHMMGLVQDEEYVEQRNGLVRQYGSWATGRAEAMCPEGDVACVRQEAERLYTSSRMRRMMK